MKRWDSLSGQIMVEYILLIVVVVTIATFLVKNLVDKDSGVLIKAWQNTLQAIATDDPNTP